MFYKIRLSDFDILLRSSDLSYYSIRDATLFKLTFKSFISFGFFYRRNAAKKSKNVSSSFYLGLTTFVVKPKRGSYNFCCKAFSFPAKLEQLEGQRRGSRASYTERCNTFWCYNKSCKASTRRCNQRSATVSLQV